MRIQIDSREKDRVQSAKEYYESQGLEVEICELEIGDYLFDNQVCYEFKTVSDFVASIQNGKVFNQAINMAETYPYNFVIIQGDDHTRAKAIAMSRNYQEITYYGYLGAIASLNRFVTVIESYSPFINEAYYRMLINAKKSLSDKPIIKKFPRKEKNPAFNWLCYCCYGVNHKRASDITKTLNLKTMEDLLYLDHKKLTSIPGIGEKLADKIIDSIQGDTYD
jgi:ERCC4-type nuclease